MQHTDVSEAAYSGHFFSRLGLCVPSKVSDLIISFSLNIFVDAKAINTFEQLCNEVANVQ